MLKEINARGIYVINMFQSQQKFANISDKPWRCNLMSQVTNKMFQNGTGATMEAAMAAAIEHTFSHSDKDIIGSVEGIPEFLTKDSSIADML